MRFIINPFTDKLDCASLVGSGAPPVETISGNDGIPVGPNGTTFNLNLIGNNVSGINVLGTPNNNTLTIYGIQASAGQRGTTRYATNSEAADQTISTAALTPSNIPSFYSTTPLPASQGGTGLSSPAANGLIVTNGSDPFIELGVAMNGEIPIGSTGAAPVLGNITSMDSSVTITNGPGTIDLSVSSSGGGITTIDGDSGSITGSTVTISGGTTGLTTSGSSSTLDLTGTLKLINGGTGASLTAHNGGVFYSTASAAAILLPVSSGNNRPLMSSGATAPFWSNISFPTSLSLNSLIYASNTNQIGTIDIGSANQVLTVNSSSSAFGWEDPSGVTLTGDLGTPISGTALNVITNYPHSGYSFYFNNDGYTNSILSLVDNVGNMMLGLISGNATMTGALNIGLGYGSSTNLTSGTFNISIGNNSGTNYTTESNNLCINSPGVSGENYAIRIAEGSANTCYIGGIARGIYTSGTPSPSLVYCDLGTGQLISGASLHSLDIVTGGFGSISANTAVQNTLGYDVLLSINVTVTASTGATLTIGVDSTNTPTNVSFTPIFTVAAATEYQVSVILPSTYYVLIGSTGTITISSITTIATQL